MDDISEVFSIYEIVAIAPVPFRMLFYLQLAGVGDAVALARGYVDGSSSVREDVEGVEIAVFIVGECYLYAIAIRLGLRLTITLDGG